MAMLFVVAKACPMRTRVALRRFFQSLLGLIIAIRRGVPAKYLTFPLARFLTPSVKSTIPTPGGDCEVLSESLDVVVSMYRPLRFRRTFELTLQSCRGNKNVRFRILLVDPTEAEECWAKSLVSGTHHTLTTSREKIGIYKTWNALIQLSEARWITNANVDDLRLPHAFCRQAFFAQQSQADITYADFYISSQPWEALDATPKWVSSLPDFKIQDLIVKSLNFPHCAPLWRRGLHEELGGFNEELISSGDAEFWARCLRREKKFVKFGEATTVYFHNPEGLSTSIRSKGRMEWGNVLRGEI